MGVGREQFLMKNDAVVTERAACFMKRFFFFFPVFTFSIEIFSVLNSQLDCRKGREEVKLI